MPTLDWIGKDKVINHHKDVPYKVFEKTDYDDFLCMDAFRMWIKSKDDLRSYSLEELEEMCPKGIRLFVRLKKLKTIQE